MMLSNEDVAFISGRAGRAFIVRGNDILTARVGAKTACAATLGQLHNFLRFYNDVFVRRETDFRSLQEALAAAWKKDRCVEFLIAAVDSTIETAVRVEAAGAADDLLRDEGVHQFARRVFLNVTPPSDADFAGLLSIATAGKLQRAGEIASAVITNLVLIARLERLWLDRRATIESTAMRDQADALLHRGQLVGRVIAAGGRGFDERAVPELVNVRTAEPEVYSIVKAWLGAARIAAKRTAVATTGRRRVVRKRKNRRVKILKLAKGFYGMKARQHRIAQQAVEKSLNTAFTGQKDRKGDFRKLWIARINAAARQNGMTYGDFIAGLKASGELSDYKTLAEWAVHDSEKFAKLAKHARAGLKRLAHPEKPS
jgi:large subunit ribosomal protein L20